MASSTRPDTQVYFNGKPLSDSKTGDMMLEISKRAHCENVFRAIRRDSSPKTGVLCVILKEDGKVYKWTIADTIETQIEDLIRLAPSIRDNNCTDIRFFQVTSGQVSHANRIKHEQIVLEKPFAVPVLA